MRARDEPPLITRCLKPSIFLYEKAIFFLVCVGGRITGRRHAKPPQGRPERVPARPRTRAGWPRLKPASMPAPARRWSLFPWQKNKLFRNKVCFPTWETNSTILAWVCFPPGETNSAQPAWVCFLTRETNPCVVKFVFHACKQTSGTQRLFVLAPPPSPTALAAQRRHVKNKVRN